MKLTEFVRAKRALLIGGALITGITAPIAFAGHASAGYTVCRSDPIVNLSNGVQLKVVDAVTDVSTDISNINYTIHVPKGVGVTKITYTGGALAGLESLTVYADQAKNSYSTTSTVTTLTAGIPVTMTITEVALPTNATITSRSVAGTSGQLLTLSWKG